MTGSWLENVNRAVGQSYKEWSLKWLDGDNRVHCIAVILWWCPSDDTCGGNIKNIKNVIWEDSKDNTDRFWISDRVSDMSDLQNHQFLEI